MAKPGHNSGAIPEGTKELVERIERLETEKADIASDIKDIYAEAKSKGHDTKVLRAVIKRRKQDAAKHEEFETSVDTYLAFLLS
jgi:uncharacterized protein (UPF0335 family)